MFSRLLSEAKPSEGEDEGKPEKGKLHRFLNSQTGGIGAAAGILAISALVSRFLGLIRDRLLAGTFGASPELDSYFAAFRIPDLVYSILIAGGVIVAFLPLFSEYFLKNQKEAWRFVNNVLSIFLFFLVLISLGILIFAPTLIKLITPGFNPEQINLTVLLTRILFLSPILLGLSSIFSGVLQYFNRFLAYSLTPVLYNLGIIFGILFIVPYFGILGVAIGVILGAFFHFAIQIPSALSCGFRYQPVFNFKAPGLKRVFLLMAPRTFAVASWQINLIVITAIASTLTTGSITIFNLANNLQYLPLGIIGTAFATAAFPFLSRFWANHQDGKFIEAFSSALRQTLYFIFPVTFLMYLLRNQIVEIVLEQGEFSQVAAQLTAVSLGLFCLGTIALSLVPLLSRIFFSFQDTKTPTLITLVVMLLNIALSFYFVRLLAPASSFGFGAGFQIFLKNVFSLQDIQNISILGLPLAWSIGSIFHFLLLITFLYKRIGDFKLKEIFSSFLKILLASILMTAGALFVIQNTSGAVFQTVAAGLAAGLIYLLATFLLKSPELKTVKTRIFKK
ncbi:MAG TPA: murein biosynthesis integral membrane protein MurJ [Candidatus Humimicrobiaceae bacterium]|nr:murein biosynthesis integral membrane protein MurJ [Candidatus Humimicrobiaceae bacterium]